MTSVSNESCWQYSMPFVLWVICSVPILATLWGWMTVYRERSKRPISVPLSPLLFLPCAPSWLLGALSSGAFRVRAIIDPLASLPEYRQDSWVMLSCLLVWCRRSCFSAT